MIKHYSIYISSYAIESENKFVYLILKLDDEFNHVIEPQLERKCHYSRQFVYCVTHIFFTYTVSLVIEKTEEVDVFEQ